MRWLLVRFVIAWALRLQGEKGTFYFSPRHSVDVLEVVNLPLSQVELPCVVPNQRNQTTFLD